MLDHLELKAFPAESQPFCGARYVAAALLNLCLNLALIPDYGARAAAINTGLTELFIFICLLYFSRL